MEENQEDFSGTFCVEAVPIKGGLNSEERSKHAFSLTDFGSSNT